jgi:drug/metabolite transporter (DMT)-like permease
MEPAGAQPGRHCRILALACISTALAYILYFRILSGAGATNVVLVTLLAPATSILLGALFLGERLAARHFFGLLLIALGLALIDGRVFRLLRWPTWGRIDAG